MTHITAITNKYYYSSIFEYSSFTKYLLSHRDDVNYFKTEERGHSVQHDCSCLHYRYEGKEATTNMVILDIKMLSGFVPVPESLRNVSNCRNFHLNSKVWCYDEGITQLNIITSQLQRALLVDRVEEKEDHVLMYIQEVRGIQVGNMTWCCEYLSLIMYSVFLQSYLRAWP